MDSDMPTQTLCGCDVAGLEEEITDLKAEVEGYEEKVEELEQELDDVKEELDEAILTQNQLEAEVLKLREEVEDKESQLRGKVEEIEALESKAEEDEKRIKALEKEVKILKEQIRVDGLLKAFEDARHKKRDEAMAMLRERLSDCLPMTFGILPRPSTPEEHPPAPIPSPKAKCEECDRLRDWCKPCLDAQYDRECEPDWPDDKSSAHFWRMTFGK